MKNIQPHEYDGRSPAPFLDKNFARSHQYTSANQTNVHLNTNNGLTREELNAKLENLELKVKTTVDNFSIRIEYLSNKIDNLEKNIKENQTEFKNEINSINTLFKNSFDDTKRDIKQEQKSSKHQMWAGILVLSTTFIVCAITIYLGISSLNHNLISNMYSAYESGSKANSIHNELNQSIIDIKNKLPQQKSPTKNNQIR